MIKDKEWAQKEIDGYLSYEGLNEARNALMFAKGVINQLDEPKPKKPVIPKFVADWFENDKEYMEIEDVFWQIENCEMVKLDVDRWISDNKNTFLRAWLDGYTIEKEPQWVVKDDTGYLSYLQFSIPDIYELETSPDKNDAYKFNSKSKADLIADLVNGTAEEVTE